MDIVKESGEKEEYRRNKFCDSLSKAGASADVVSRVCEKIEHDIEDGTTTEELFRRAFEYLKKEDIRVAARYSLKRGIAALGPAGFHFEHYIERLLNAYGFRTRRNNILRGVCVSHEVDIVAEQEKTHFLIEVKYHNSLGIKTDVTVAMYADARLADIAPMQKKEEAGRETMHRMWLITNTKFTETAVQYGKCKHLRMTGWSYPHEESLESLILEKKLFPVTVLPSVIPSALPSFARENLMLVSDLLSLTPGALSSRVGLSKDRATEIISEALVCSAGEKG